MITLVQVSELHLDGTAVATERTRRVAAYVRSLDPPPDAVVVSGDVADHGTPAEYAEAAALDLGPAPVVWITGNHDAREPFRDGLLGGVPLPGTGDEPLDQVHDLPGGRLLLADSLVPGAGYGHLAATTLAWLDRTLAAAPAIPAIVVLHHPPVDLGLPYVDAIKLDNAADLAAVLDAHPQVRAVLCGHAHTAAATTFAGRPLLVAPGVRSTLLLDSEPYGDVATDALPPGLAFHRLDDDGRVTTHFRVVP